MIAKYECRLVAICLVIVAFDRAFPKMKYAMIILGECPLSICYYISATNIETLKWWGRLVLGSWMLLTLVLTRSYAGKLTSLLAVRYIPQPFHTLKGLLDSTTTSMIWEANTAFVEHYKVSLNVIFMHKNHMLYTVSPKWRTSILLQVNGRNINRGGLLGVMSDYKGVS